jgi:flagellar basal-body rod modification protein FlgD
MVAPVSASTPSASNTASDTSNAAKQLSSNFSTFLTLLTTQLKNQDPTSPMDSNTFTQQLVMYSQVEQQIDTNNNLQTLIGQGTTSASATAATYLGKKVSVTNGNASLTGGTAAWTYNLGTASATTQLAITDSKGRTVFTANGENTSGDHSFTWNGQDMSGNQLADGTYKLSVTAADSAGSTVTTSVASAGTVSQIDMTSGTPKLVVGNMELGPGDVAAIGN